MTMNEIQARFDRVESLRNTPVLTPAWPPEGEPLTLEAALEAANQAERAEAFGKVLHAARALLSMSQYPIMAVLGGLNAGKSSVVASFLSSSGRQRVPRGQADKQGTHRFVYWVPESWLKEEAIRNAFFELLTAVHGPEREYPSDDPLKAEGQYGSGRNDLAVLKIPLIATDTNLDALQTALLDCPDVQTHDRDAPASASRLDNPRLDFLMDSSRICSAFLVVWLRGQMRDGLLGVMLKRLRERAVKAPVYLLLNQIEPGEGEPARTLYDSDVIRNLKDSGIGDHCYGAFDFNLSGWKSLTPQPLVKSHNADKQVTKQHDSHKTKLIPQFFVISTDAAKNAPETIPEDHYLIHLPRRLNVAELQQQKLHDSWNELGLRIREDLDHVQAWAESRRDRARAIHQGLLDFCVQKFTDPQNHEPVQGASREFPGKLQTSFVRTAPIPVRLALKLSQPFEKVVNKALKTLSRFNPLRRAGEELSELESKIEDTLGIKGLRISNEQELASEMKALRFVPSSAEVGQLERAWKSILEAFILHPVQTDVAHELDQITKKIWGHLSFLAKLRIALMSLFKSLGFIDK
jgi:hypothetical protein